MKNASKAYYLQVLGLSSNFTDSELKNAYRKEAKKWHPDLNKDDIYAEERLKLINEAYVFLKESNNKSTKVKVPNNYSENKKSQKENNSGVKSKDNNFSIKIKKFIFYLGGLISPGIFLASIFILAAFGSNIGLFDLVLISTLILGTIFFIRLNNYQLNWYKNFGGKISEKKIRDFAKVWWILGASLIGISVFILIGLEALFTNAPNQTKKILNKNEKVNKAPKKERNYSLENPKSKGLFDGMTVENFLDVANNDIANEPENPDGYALRGLIYFYLKKYQSASRDLNKAIKLNDDYIDEELYFIRGIINLKKSKKRGDIFEKKGCKDLKVVFESDIDYQSNAFDEAYLNELGIDLSAVRKMQNWSVNQKIMMNIENSHQFETNNFCFVKNLIKKYDYF